MNLFISKLNKNLNSQLQKIDLEEPDIIRKSHKSIHCVKDSLTQLKEFILQHNFCNEAEEIRFFKEIKPELFSQLIYYVKIFNIESRRPMGSYENQKNHLLNELEKLTFFFNSHLEFYQYYRMNSTILDDKYFVRGKEDIHLYQDSLMFYVDPEFSTSHDNVVAKILAYDRLEVYLKTELETLALKSANPNWGQLGNIGNNPLKWTDNKTALVELIYALHAAGSINKGQIEIREIAAFFEQSFGIKLTDIYRTYLEIKIRSTPTKYLDTLKSTFLRKMEESY